MFFWFKKRPKIIEAGPFASYQLIERINEGGMAEVWFALDANEKPVAIRILTPEAQTDATAWKRFFRGAKILKKLQPHPSVVGYYSHGKYHGIPYIALEYVEAHNLKLLITKADPILEELVGHILISAAEALEYVHEKGYIHLDFKPENILVKRTGQIKLVDFDMAVRLMPKPKRLKSYPGTPQYMAPEMLMRKEIDHRVDIFAFGVTAYELLTFEKPFPGRSPEEILQLQLKGGGPIPPRRLNPSIPVELEKIIMRCLEIDPQKRFGLMHHVVKSLEQVLYIY